MILATIHFLDGETLEQEFDDKIVQFCGQSCEDTMRIWLNNTQWVSLGNGEYRPMSQVSKVTWKELATPPEKE